MCSSVVTGACTDSKNGFWQDRFPCVCTHILKFHYTFPLAFIKNNYLVNIVLVVVAVVVVADVVISLYG